MATYTAWPLGHSFREPIFVVACLYPNALSAQMNVGKKVLALQAHRETWLNDRQRTMMSKVIYISPVVSYFYYVNARNATTRGTRKVSTHGSVFLLYEAYS